MRNNRKWKRKGRRQKMSSSLTNFICMLVANDVIMTRDFDKSAGNRKVKKRVKKGAQNWFLDKS